MSIGKKLLSLRQQERLSQQELADYLHVSRQTVSKWESDLSLPDMNMVVSIASFYNITVGELLGLDEQSSEDSLKNLYDQTNLVLENIQKENKKRKRLDICVILVCLLCLAISIVLLIKVSKKQESVIIHNNYPTTNVNNQFYGDCDVKIHSYDFDKLVADSTFHAEIDGLGKEDKVNIVLKDVNGNIYEYPMIRLSDFELEYRGLIPIVEYEDEYIGINQEGKTYRKYIVDVDMFNSVEEFLTEAIHLTVGLENSKLVHDKICYFFEPSTKGKNITGLENSKITFVISTLDTNEILLNETIDYTKDAFMYTSRRLRLYDQINVEYIIDHNGKRYIGNKHVNYIYSSNFIAHRQLIE